MAAPADPPLVTSIEIRTDEELAHRIDLGRLLELEIGAPLTPAAVRRTLSNAHASGLFAELELLTFDDDNAGGVGVVLVLRGYLRLRRIELLIEEAGGGSRTKRDLGLREGQILDEDRLQDGLESLRQAWLDRGFRDVHIDAELVPTGQINQVDLQVAVTPGERPVVSEIRFDGLRLEPSEVGTLLDALPVEVGDPWRPDRLEESREHLRRHLAERGYLAAEVSDPQTEFPTPKQAILSFPMEPGPRIEVEVIGAETRALRRHGFLPFLGERPFREDLLRSSAQEIRRRYQERGYRLARVQVERRSDETEDSAPSQRWRLKIEPGERWWLRTIDFAGNEAVSDDDLLRLISTRVKRWLEPGSGRLVDDQLVSDLETIRSYYLLQGFSEVVVHPPEITFSEPGDRSGPGSLALRIPIDEGPRQRVVNLDLDGVEAFDEVEVRDRLTLQPGGPFHPLLLDDAVDVLRALYEDEGYRVALVTPRLDWNDDRSLVDVALHVEEGPRTVVDRLVLRGLVRTRPEVVREFADLQKGKPLRRRGLLRAERDLYRLGVFSKVEVEPSPSGPTPPQDGVRSRDVLIDLEEGSRWRVSYGLSFHSDDGLGGLFGLTRSHIAGRAARFQLDLRASENDRRARLVFDDPSLLRRKLPLTWSLFVRDEERPTFSVQETGAQLALIRDRGRFRWGLTWDYRLVEISGQPDLAGLEREDQDVEISSITPNFFYDRRDDPLDPRQGGSTAFQLEWAFPALDAEADFAKLFVQQTWHHSLHRAGVLAWSARFGAIEPIGSMPTSDPFLDPSQPSSRVPISERFFAGGRTSHRAYERDALGLLGQSLLETEDGRILQLGGNGLLLFNLDYRFPIAGDFGGVVWSDVGNVWADWRDLRADDLRVGAGVGLRYRSPVGPVRIEIGWKLDRLFFEEAGPVFFLSFGNPF